MNCGKNCDIFAAETQARSVVTDVMDRLTSNLVKIAEAFFVGYLTRNHNQPGGNKGFDCYAGSGILLNQVVEDRIRDLVGDLVGMPHGYRFGSKQVGFCHFMYLW